MYTSVAFAGPPAVMMYAAVNTWNEPIMPRTMLKNTAGVIIGTVMFRKRCHTPAPSIIAASCRCCGTP